MHPGGLVFYPEHRETYQRSSFDVIELHTIIHIFCAFGMYVIWFKKPYNVNSPHVCDDPRVIELAALFALNKDGKDFGKKNTSDMKERACCQIHEIGPKQVREAHPKSSSSDVKIGPHLFLANRAVDLLKDKGSHFWWFLHEDGELTLETDFVVSSRSDFRIEGRLEKEIQRGGDRDRQDTRTFNMALLLSMLYGGAHLSAWPAHFPTAIEMWMWRSSAITLIAFPIVYPPVAEFLNPSPGQAKLILKIFGSSRRSKQAVRGVVNGVGFLSVLVLMVVVTVYPAARLYILAESFASLRNPPARTYETVEWTDFIPHAS